MNEVPTDLAFAGNAVNENAAAGTVVSTLSTTDPDAGDSFTYTLANDPSGFFEVVGNEVRVAAGAAIDFEAATSHDIDVTVTDSGGLTRTETVTITVNDVNEVPTDLAFAGNAVNENATAGTVVSTL